MPGEEFHALCKTKKACFAYQRTEHYSDQVPRPNDGSLCPISPA